MIKTVAAVTGGLIIGAVVMFFLAAPNVSALEFNPYSADEFQAAQAAGAPVLIDIHADWCSTCQAQRRVLSSLVDDPRFADLVIFEVDYDTEKNIMRHFFASQRSTLIVFRGSTEFGRIVGITNFAAIEALLVAVVE